MNNQVIDLGIRFVRGWEPAPPVPDPGEDIAGGLVQTGDFSIALIVGLVLMAMTTAGIIAYALMQNKQIARASHASVNSLKLFNFANFSLQAKIISAVVNIIAFICIIFGCATLSAHAANEEGSITVTPNTITAVVAEDGHISAWDPSSATLANTSTTDKFDFTSCKVSLTDEAKSVETIQSATIKITGFEGKVVFKGTASDAEIPCEGLSLDKSASTNLEIEIDNALDVAQLEALFDKQLFKISLNAKVFIPLYDNLYEYSLAELQTVSNYLVENYSEESTDPVCVKFRSFRDNGLTTDGTDNGVPMSQNENASNHWAIDTNGKLYGQADFLDGDNSTIQTRIIGINEDVDQNGNKIGLTFMTTHALSEKSAYESDRVYYAKFGWAGPYEGDKCTVRAKLDEGTLFPQALQDYVKAGKKGYQYSIDALSGSNIATDKFWAPSMEELYGECSGTFDGWWPSENEGNQYKAFLNSNITQNNYGCFANIDWYQTGNSSGGTTFVWSRSLSWESAATACGVLGRNGGQPYGHDVFYSDGVVACFCI